MTDGLKRYRWVRTIGTTRYDAGRQLAMRWRKGGARTNLPTFQQQLCNLLDHARNSGVIVRAHQLAQV